MRRLFDLAFLIVSLAACKPLFGVKSGTESEARPAKSEAATPSGPQSAPAGAAGIGSLKQAKGLDSSRSFVDLDSSDESRKDCNKAPGLATVEVPLNHDEPNGKKIRYAYQLAKGSRPGVVVQIPGGPGGDDIVTSREELSSVSESNGGYSVVLIDPRGVGCNADIPGLLLGNVSTYQHARDIIAVVKSLAPTDLVLLGSSYGTAVATVTASLAESEGLRPKAVVLQGVLGGVAEGEQEFVQVWDWVRKSVPGAARFAAAPPAWTEVTRDDLAVIIRMMASYDPRFLRDALKLSMVQADEPDDDTLKIWQIFRSILAEDDAKETQGSTAFYLAVACREIFKSVAAGRLVLESDGRLVNKPSTDGDQICKKADLELVAPFRPADYAISSPIYYIQGTRDPNTPLAGARNHLKSVKGTGKKEFIEIVDGGHGPLQAELGGCSAALFAKFFSGQSVRKALDSEGRCPDDGLSLTRRMPEAKMIRRALRLIPTTP